MKETGSPKLSFENLEARASVTPSTPPERSSGGHNFIPHTHWRGLERRRACARFDGEGERVLSEPETVSPLIEVMYSSMPVLRWSTRIMLISSVSMISTRVNSLNSEKGKKNTTDQVIKRSKELYGYTPAEKSDENIEWMLRNGYIKEKRHKRGTRGRRWKSEFT